MIQHAAQRSGNYNKVYIICVFLSSAADSRVFIRTFLDFGEEPRQAAPLRRRSAAPPPMGEDFRRGCAPLPPFLFAFGEEKGKCCCPDSRVFIRTFWDFGEEPRQAAPSAAVRRHLPQWGRIMGGAVPRCPPVSMGRAEACNLAVSTKQAPDVLRGLDQVFSL